MAKSKEKKNKHEYAMAICSTKSTQTVPGKWRMCIECMIPVFVSQSTVNVMKKFPGVILEPHCYDCGSKIMKQEKLEILPPSREQLVEFKNSIKNKFH